MSATDDPIFEERVRYWQRRLEQGRPVPPINVVERADGKHALLGEEARALAAACGRVGRTEFECFVVKAEDLPPPGSEELDRFIRGLDRRMASDN
jgi:hypothetical protein